MGFLEKIYENYQGFNFFYTVKTEKDRIFEPKLKEGNIPLQTFNGKANLYMNINLDVTKKVQILNYFS